MCASIIGHGKLCVLKYKFDIHKGKYNQILVTQNINFGI